MLPDFNRLKVFYHVYQQLSISTAARALHLTQSAVSQHVRKLEAELGTRLFTRLPRKLVPTRAGERLFAMVQPFVHNLEQGLQDIQASRSHPRGLLRVGAPAAFGENVLPRFIADYRSVYPQVRFHLSLGHPKFLLPAVRSGRLDFAFADIFSPDERFSPDRAGLSIVPLVEEELILVCSTPYYQTHIRGKKKKDVFRQGAFVAYHPEAPALRSWLKHHYGIAQAQPDVVLAVESVRAVITAVGNHLGLGVVPAHLVQKALGQGRLTRMRSSPKELINRIALVQLQNKIPGITEKTFIRHVENLWRREYEKEPAPA